MTIRMSDDVVDVLIGQHAQLNDLMIGVAAADGNERRRLLDVLAGRVHAHEAGERVVVYPVVCDRTRGGGPVAVACLAEGAQVAQAAAELLELGADHPTFGVQFAALHQAFLDHAAREENVEFPRLRRYVPTQKLHTMANELRNVQTMS
jgi:hypothetical protein